MTRRFFLVTGPEGSGTYMMAEALASCGVTEVIRGQQTYPNPETYRHLIPAMNDLIFTHRSLPAAGMWPDLPSFYYAFGKARYKCQFIFMTREINATARSQIRRGVVADLGIALANIIEAYRQIASTELYAEWLPVSYEAFVNSAGFRRWLFVDLLKLPMPTIEVRDENKKYYE